MTIQSPLLFKIGCACMISLMGLGARFGHAGQLSQNGSTMFMKAQFYNLTNAVALIGCSLVSKVHSIPFKIAAVSFLAAEMMFVAPLYYTAIKQQKHKVLVKLMPAGGGAMIVGWTSLMLAA